MTHSVLSSTSALSEKLSLPLTVKPCSGCELTSRTTSLPLSMVTSSPARGTCPLGQVAGSDQRACLIPGDVPSAACATANTPPRRTAGKSETTRNERFFLLMTSTPAHEYDPILMPHTKARL